MENVCQSFNFTQADLLSGSLELFTKVLYFFIYHHPSFDGKTPPIQLYYR